MELPGTRILYLMRFFLTKLFIISTTPGFVLEFAINIYLGPKFGRKNGILL